MGSEAPPGETGATLTVEEVACLLAALEFYEAARWARMPRAGSPGYHAAVPSMGVAYVLRGRLQRRLAELVAGAEARHA